MTESPLVSVLLPVYNDASTVAPALDSVLAREFGSFEVIVINGGSTDDTRKQLRPYVDDDCVIIIHHDRNKGLPSAFNTGIRRATGSYLMRQDADDRSLPGRMRRQYEYLGSHPDMALLGTGAEVIDSKGEFLYEIADRDKLRPSTI
jgi:glycosyltransferase involved in cell wall biosynthesis